MRLHITGDTIPCCSDCLHMIANGEIGDKSAAQNEAHSKLIADRFPHDDLAIADSDVERFSSTCNVCGSGLFGTVATVMSSRSIPDYVAKLEPLVQACHRGYRLWSAILTHIVHHHDPHEDETCVSFEIAAALHWFTQWHWNGQADPLYALHCALDYRPGACENGPEPGSADGELLAELESVLE